VLRALTPLYLAWVASYALESDESGARLERVSLAFEESKPYALSRWRWPDRFTP
jgi:glucosylglycerate synthase